VVSIKIGIVVMISLFMGISLGGAIEGEKEISAEVTWTFVCAKANRLKVRLLLVAERI
jgi:hypothetical protein